MAGQHHDERPGRGLRPGGAEPAPGDDILEHGRERPPRPRRAPAVRWPPAWPRPPRLRWPPPPAAVLLLAAGLVAGLAAGYAAGDRHAARSAAPLRSAAAPEAARLAAGGLPVGQAGPACSAQIGSELQLGLQVTNASGAGMTLRRVETILPIGGLREVGQAWGPCGELPQADAASAASLPAGASAWFTVTFRVLIRCPGPLPVQFVVHYVQRGRPASVRLPGFDDLGQVPYSGCP
jgi:hypothetical protein